MIRQHLKKYKRFVPAAFLVVLVLGLGLWRVHAYSFWFTEDMTQSNWEGYYPVDWVVTGYLSNYSGGVVTSVPGYCGSALSGYNSYGFGEISLTVQWNPSNVGAASILLGADSSSEQYPYVGGTGSYQEIDYSATDSGYGYQGIISVYYNSGGTQRGVASGSFTPNPGSDTISVLTNGSTEAVYVDGTMVISFTAPGSGTSGYYGFGTCSDYLDEAGVISSFSLGPRGGSPNAIPASQIGVSPFSNKVDFQWPAATETDPQVGILEYQIYRNGSLLTTTNSLSYSDTTVTPYTTYTYTLSVVDQFYNTASTNLTVNVPPVGPPQNPTSPPYPSTTPEGRRVGVRPTGAYWGASGENIDVLSGNLSFAQPLISAQGRDGWSAGFNLIYNSQNWRKDSGGIWEFNEDVGYGYGWRLMPGAIEPVYTDNGQQISSFIFIDGSGAEYTLNQQNGNIWSSQQSTYVWWDDYGLVLHFRDGSAWTFDCVSASNQPDAGFMYPTQIEDPNGNQILIRYQTAPGSSWANSTARISQIEDVRATPEAGGVYYTYAFNYNSDSTPHLTSITNTIGTGETYNFSYTTAQTLEDPFASYPNNTHGSTKFLQTATITNVGTYYQFSTDQYGEVTGIQLPYKGTLGYTYTTTQYQDGRTFREITNRSLSTCNSAGQGCESGTGQYAISHESSPGYDVHQFTLIEDPGGVGEKYWAFYPSGTYEGLASTYQGRDRNAGGPGNCISGNSTGLGACKVENDYTWALDAISTGNSYISQVVDTLDPSSSNAVHSSTSQTMDIHGNVTQVMNNNFSGDSPSARTSTYTYLSSSNYTSRYIYNRLVTASETDGTNNLTLASNTYDCGYGCIGSGYSPNPREWDVNFAGVGYRGNLTTSVTLSGTSTASYDMYGNATSGANNNGVSSASTITSGTNYAAPTTITVGGSLTTSLSYASAGFLGLATATDPNNTTTVDLGYDANARPTSSTSQFGATTTTQYNNTASPPNSCTMVDGRWTQTNLDGLGRPILTITGNGSSCGQGNTVSQSETTYGPCGCTPVGKMISQTIPHAPGSPGATTTYTYDGVGRTLSKAVVGTGSSPDTQGATNYLYQGNTITVTDPAGKWKIYTTDGFGNLVQVAEPNPGGGSNYTTSYTYDVLNHLINVSMPRSTGTQTRSWTYNGVFLTSATNPENGTVSYTYGSNNLVATKTDAKGQQTVYSYDGMARLAEVQHYVNYGGPPATIAITAYGTAVSGVYPLLYVMYGWTGPGTGALLAQIQLSGTSQTYTIPNFLGTYGNLEIGLLDQSGYTLTIPSITVKGVVYNTNASSVYDTCTGSYAETTSLSCANGAFIYQTGASEGTPPNLAIDNCQTVNYSYGGNNPLGPPIPYAAGRLSAIQYYSGVSVPSVSPDLPCATTFTELYTYDNRGAPTGKQLTVTRDYEYQEDEENIFQNFNVNLNATYTSDTEGRITNVTYPTDSSGNTANLSYTFDSMGRLNTMTDNIANQQIIQGATYGPANEMTYLEGGSYLGARASETRTYNSIKQLTSISVPSVINTSYSYPSLSSPAGNNGKIQSQYDAISGETVTYTYDALNRLSSATNSGASPPWGQSFTYDGFGNLTQTSATQGSAPGFTQTYNGNNQLGNEDANGNPPSVPLPAYNSSATPTFDVENRLVQLSTGGSPAINYAYDPANHRVWRYDPNNSPTTDEVTFWSITGQKLGTYQVTYNAGNGACCYGEGNYQAPQFTVAQTAINLYFGSKLIKDNNGWVYPDRLGSIGKFYPYGIERPSATANGTEKFTGYFRDAESGNDYAVNRYQSPGYGRFLTPDPGGHRNLKDPGSWNKYAYVGGDPINRRDLKGLCSTDGDGSFWDDDDTGAVYLFDGDCSDDADWVAEVSTSPFVLYNDEPFWTALATASSEQTCGPGYFWDPSINACDVPLTPQAQAIFAQVNADNPGGFINAAGLVTAIGLIPAGTGTLLLEGGAYGVTMLGSTYGQGVNYAMLGQIVGGTTDTSLFVDPAIWAAMGTAGQQASMQAFINAAIQADDLIVFASDPTAPGVSAGMAYEWQYLQSLGATLQAAGNGAFQVQIPESVFISMQ